MRGFLENKVLFKAVYPDNLEDMVAGSTVGWSAESNQSRTARPQLVRVSGGSLETIFGKSMWMLVSIGIGDLDFCQVLGSTQDLLPRVNHVEKPRLALCFRRIRLSQGSLALSLSLSLSLSLCPLSLPGCLSLGASCDSLVRVLR